MGKNKQGDTAADSQPGQKNPSRGSEFFVFARNFLKHPTAVGWMLPSSPFLVDEVLKEVHWQRAKVIIEYGPGTGAFTRRVLERMRSDAKLIALEINPEFFQHLQAAFPDPRFHLVNRSAADVDEVLARFGCDKADYVISGIPFKTLPHALRTVIVQKTHSILSPNGHFLVYQFSSAVRPYLEQVFRRVSHDFELLNIIPAQLFFCAP